MAVRQGVLSQVYSMREAPASTTLDCRLLGPYGRVQARRDENINRQLDSMMQAQQRKIQRIEENYRRACRSHDAQMQWLSMRKQNSKTEYRNQMRNVLGYMAVDMAAWQVAINDVILFIGLSSPIWLLILMPLLL